jgi:hypothetical protein
MFATLYKWEGERKNVLPPGSREFTMEELKELVGGYFEIFQMSKRTCKRLGVPKGSILVCNEEGRLLNLPPNIVVSQASGTTFCGNIIVCSSKLVS